MSTVFLPEVIAALRAYYRAVEECGYELAVDETLADRIQNFGIDIPWQPIETAPKDSGGELLLGWFVEHNSGGPGLITWSEIHQCWFDDQGHRKRNPSHWARITPPA